MSKKEGWMARARRLAEKWAMLESVSDKFEYRTKLENRFAGYVTGFRAGRRSKP